MSKYIDLAERVKRGHGDDEVRRGIDYALEWLDNHPDQVPGRTITESDWNEACKLSMGGNMTAPGRLAARLGITIVPDPEPTNAERLEQLIRESGFSITYAGQNSDPIELAKYLNEDGVKAPDHD